MVNKNRSDAEAIKNILEGLRGVLSVGDIKIEDGMIEYISLESDSLDGLAIQRLKVADSPALFDFYFNGISQESRNFFPPYPLFSPPPDSVAELSGRIKDWEEEDDWTFLILVKGKQIIGVCLLKRYKTERPTSGLAVREAFQNAGLGVLLQTIINEQARLLGLTRVYATTAQNNEASLKVHQKCGFKQTGKLVPHYSYKNGRKEIDRQDVEMVLELGASDRKKL